MRVSGMVVNVSYVSQQLAYLSSYSEKSEARAIVRCGGSSGCLPQPHCTTLAQNITTEQLLIICVLIFRVRDPVYFLYLPSSTVNFLYLPCPSDSSM
jgi:hypothetical protein